MPVVRVLKPAAVAGALCLLAMGAHAQTSGDSKPERGMPSATSAPPGAKSERAMPAQTKDAEPPPAGAERAMPASPGKK